jgi:hypothetical protein
MIFERQWLHAFALMILLAGVTAMRRLDALQTGDLAGVSASAWLWTAVTIAVTHQVFVWLCWRTQLHLSLLTRTLGRRAFSVFAVLFSILGLARATAVYLLAIANQDTLPANRPALQILAALLAVPTAYLFYSLKRYFGFRRAFGIDHFDESYRAKPPVRQGIFRYTRNGMYVFGFLILWIPALWWASAAALTAAAFNHLYVWVHYYATELPDIKRIYSRPFDPPPSSV